MTSRMQQRRDTAANWTSNNPTLAAGEMGLESDTSKFKIGNGTSTWTALAYSNGITPTSTDTLTNKTLVNDALVGALENANIVASAATGTINVDVITSSLWYYTTNATANFTLNIRGNSGTSLNSLMSNNQVITIVFLNTNGSTAYYASAFTIDGTSVSPKWQTGTAPTGGNASAIDVYSYSIVKTGSATYTVLASQTKFA